MEHLLHAEQLFGFRLSKIGNRHASGHGNHIGNIFYRNLVNRVAVLFFPCLSRFIALGNKLHFLFVQDVCTLEVLLCDGVILLRTNGAQLVCDLLHLFGQNHVADAHARTCFIQNVNGLIGKETILDVTVGKAYRGTQCIIGEMHMMVRFVTVTQTLKNAHSLLFAWLLHHYRLEAALESGILFQMLAVLVKRGSADDLDFAA